MRFLPVIFLIFQATVFAADTPAVPLVNNQVVNGEIRYYNFSGNVSGTAYDEIQQKQVPYNAQLSFKIKHKYGTRDSEGIIPLDISFVEGKAKIGEEELALTSSLYPMITALLNNEFKITQLYGITPERYAQDNPGINYSNSIILFYLLGAEVPRIPGEKWEYSVTIPVLNETYKFINTLVAVEELEGKKVVKVDQQITRAPKEEKVPVNVSTKTTGYFRVSDGVLVKSRVVSNVTLDESKCSVDSAQRAAAEPVRRNIEFDISAIRD